MKLVVLGATMADAISLKTGKVPIRLCAELGPDQQHWKVILLLVEKKVEMPHETSLSYL